MELTRIVGRTTAQDCYLAYFLTELAGATFMVFTRTCEQARRAALQLRNLGFDALPIHGQMSQPKRLGALNKFKAGERSILVATGAFGTLCGHHPAASCNLQCSLAEPSVLFWGFQLHGTILSGTCLPCQRASLRTKEAWRLQVLL